MDWEKPFRKNPNQKIEKTVKIKVKFPHAKKNSSEKANFCSNIVFSLYFKSRAKKFHAAKPLAFSLHFLFQRDQNHNYNLTSKIMKMCEQILKKDNAPIKFNSLNSKKTKRRPIIAPAIAVRLLNNKNKNGRNTKGTSFETFNSKEKTISPHWWLKHFKKAHLKQVYCL